MAGCLVHGSRLAHARALALVLLTPLVVGCTTFKSTRRLDVGPFAQNTVGMIGEVQRATKPVVWTYLKEYESLPSVLAVREAFEPARTLMRGVALYSTQIVAIYESDLTEAQKAHELAQYLEAVRDRIRQNPKSDLYLTQASLDSAVTRVRAAPTFMAALGAAQPVVSAALGFGNAVFDSLDHKIDVAAADIDHRLEAEHAPLKQQLDEVSDLQMGATARYLWLSKYRLGDSVALDSLRAHDPDFVAATPAGRPPTAATLETTEKRILGQLETLTTLRGQLEQEFADYRSEQTELDAIRIQDREATRLGRITLILWARSHRNLAAGVKVPAAIDVLGMAQNAAGRATDVVIP